MPRNRKCRFVNAQPRVTMYKPSGVPGHTLEVVNLGLDELEALRLADQEGLYQEAAAARMGISRPTFSRLIDAARRKVADALLGGKAIVIEGGPVVRGQVRSFVCRACNERFQLPHGSGPPSACPACGSAEFQRIDDDRGRGRGRCARGGGGHCHGRGHGHGAGGAFRQE